MNTLKNWWPQILLFLGGMIEFLTDFLPVLLEQVNLDPKLADCIRILLLAFSLYQSKKAASSTNPEKLYEQAHKAQVKKLS